MNTKILLLTLSLFPLEYDRPLLQLHRSAEELAHAVYKLKPSSPYDYSGYPIDIDYSSTGNGFYPRRCLTMEGNPVSKKAASNRCLDELLLLKNFIATAKGEKVEQLREKLEKKEDQLTAYIWEKFIHNFPATYQRNTLFTDKVKEIIKLNNIILRAFEISELNIGYAEEQCYFLASKMLSSIRTAVYAIDSLYLVKINRPDGSTQAFLARLY